MGWDAPWHWVIVALVVIALFGYKKLPEASRSLGRSLRIFKTEIKGMGEDDKARESAHDTTTATPAVVVKQVEAPPAEPAPAPEATVPRVPPASSATVPSTDKPATGAK